MSSEEENPAWLEPKHDQKYSGNVKKDEETPLLGSGNPPLYDQTAGDETDAGSNKKNDAFDVEEGSSTAGKTQVSQPSTADVSSAASKHDPTMPHRPRENPCLWLFHLLQFLAATSSLCLFVTQILPLCFVKLQEIPTRIGVLSLALKVYLSLFCFLFVLVEADAPLPFVRSSKLLQTFFSRGFIYSFIGLICVEEAYSERVKDIVSHGKDEFHVGWVAIFMQISSWVMLGVGCIYMLLGMCCLGLLRDRLKQKEKDDWKEYREAMKKWKEQHPD